MNKLIGYNARDFLVIMEQVKAKVHDKMCKKLNEGLDYPKYYPEFIKVHAKVIGPGHRSINLCDSSIYGVHIDPSKTKVYKSHTKSLCGEMVTVSIVFVAVYIQHHNPDVLNIGETPLTFDSHESLLRFVAESHRNPDDVLSEPDISVSLFDKGTGMEIYEVFRNLCKKDESIPTLTDDEFTTLEGYSSLSQETKDQVNKMLYPLTVTGKNVRLIHPRGWYNIFVEKEVFINEHLATTELDDDIIHVISQ